VEVEVQGVGEEEAHSKVGEEVPEEETEGGKIVDLRDQTISDNGVKRSLAIKLSIFVN